jgi:NitT/TauT family transport system permease protein
VLGAITLARVMVLIVVASLVWVPLGVLIGLRPRVAEKVQPLPSFWRLFRPTCCFRCSWC